jgi:uncharacterized protein YegP (UPF0339 family)
MMRIEIYQDKAKAYRWRLVSRNGRIIADGAEGYTKKHNAQRAVKRFLALLTEDILIAES